MLKHMHTEGDGTVLLIADTACNIMIAINGESRRITFYSRRTGGDVGIEGIPFAPDHLPDHTIRFPRPPRNGNDPLGREGRMLVYTAAAEPPSTDNSRPTLTTNLFIGRDEKARLYTFALATGFAHDDWSTYVTFDELDKASQATDDPPPTEALPKGDTMAYERYRIATEIARLILIDESDTYSSDDAENRPDATTLRMLAENAHIAPLVDTLLDRMRANHVWTFDIAEESLSIQIDVKAKTEGEARHYLGNAMKDGAFAPFYSSGGERSEAAEKYEDILDARLMIDTSKVLGHIELVDHYELDE